MIRCNDACTPQKLTTCRPYPDLHMRCRILLLPATEPSCKRRAHSSSSSSSSRSRTRSSQAVHPRPSPACQTLPP